LRLKEHASLCVLRNTEARPRARITLHVYSSVPNHTPHNLEMIMTNAHLFKRELASPSVYNSLSTTLSTHSFSVPLLTWASEFYRTCRQLSFHREDSTSLCRKPLPSHWSIIRHCCHASVLTGQIKFQLSKNLIILLQTKMVNITLLEWSYMWSKSKSHRFIKILWRKKIIFTLLEWSYMRSKSKNNNFIIQSNHLLKKI